jgi:hypothetical protein
MPFGITPVSHDSIEKLYTLLHENAIGARDIYKKDIFLRAENPACRFCKNRRKNLQKGRKAAQTASCNAAEKVIQ